MILFYKQKRISILCFIFLWLSLLFSNGIFSQQNTSVITLADRLEELKETYGVKFSYNYTFINQINVPSNTDCNSLASCLNAINELVPVSFQESSANNYMVIPIRKNISFSVLDASTNELVADISYQINNGPENYIYPKKSIYTIKNVFPLDSIHISSPYYESIHTKASELLQLNKPLQLEHKTIHLNEVQITDYLTRGINAKISDNTIQVDMSSLGLLAGETDGDIFNVVKNVPGVHAPSGKPGSLNFRGSTFDRSLIQIDDIPIYHNGHFYGALAPYNPTIVNHIEIQRNTLSAKWGGRVGGLINMTTSTIVPDSTTYSVQANTIYGGITVKLPLVKEKLAFYLAGRSNYPSINSPKLTAFSNLNFQGSRLASVAEDVNSGNFQVGFYDINSKLIYDINDNHKATISYINIINRLSATLKDYDDDDQKDFRDLSLDNWGMTMKWEGRFSEKFSAEARLVRSSLTIDNISEGFSGTERNSFEKYTNTIDDTRLISEVSLELDEGTKLEAGYTLTDYKIRYDERNDANSIDSKRNQDALMHSMFLNLNKNWNDKVTANIGLHTDYYEPTGKLYVDPRVSINVKANEDLFFKTSAGRAHQFIQKKLRDDFDDFNNQSQFWYLPDKTTAVLDGYQGMIGALYTKSGWLVDIELYARNTNNVTFQTSTETLEDGKLKSIGADFFVKKRWNHLETWLSYSLSKVDTDFGEVLPVFFDQRHILNITGLWQLDPFNFTVTWSYMTGMPVIIPELETTDSSFISQLQIPYTDRFPSQHQLDVSATYSFSNAKKSWKGIVGLSFVNLYNQDNIVNIFQNAPSVDDPYRKAIEFSPNLQLSFQF
ncbi:TonB-dependent receptor plug domain-containing protein [Zobellia nedashkovskayae]|uniref:TonB-dependent receptor plug domain-containing protein n=1 Tax=Zobellia nedashkovskayae TaxID=2779510 RepID=UPI0039F10DC4